MRSTSRAVAGFILLLGAALAIAAVGFFLISARFENNQSAGGRGGGFFGSQEPSYTVDLKVFEAQDFTPIITGFGLITAGRTAELRPRVSGLLATSAPTLVEGVFIAKGDPLFTVDPFEFELAVKEAEIALSDARVRLETAQADLSVEVAALALAEDQLALSLDDLNRQRQLLEREVVSAAAVDNAKNATLTARSSVDARRGGVARAEAAIPTATLAVERASLNLERAQRNLQNTTLTAPFDGLAQNVSFALGRQVSSNDILARLVDLSQLELRFQLSDEQLGGLISASGNRDALRGLPITLSWDVGSQVLTYAAKIDRTAVAIAENQGGIDIFARLQGVTPDTVPPVGAFMAYNLSEPKVRGAFAVPAEAVSPSGEMFAVDENNRITVFKVEIERRVGETTLVAGEAVKPGATYVARRFIQLGEGTKVNPNRPEVPEAEAEVAGAGAGAGAGQTGGIPEDDPLTLDATQQNCLRNLIASADSLPDGARERIAAAIDQGTIENPERLKGMQSRTGLDIDSCFPAPTVAAAAPMGDPGGFPTGDGSIDLTPEQQACLIEAVENSSLPDMPKGFIIPALERGTISDPSRMAGLKERAGIDLDSCFPPSLPVAG